MRPRYQYPSTNGTQNLASTIPRYIQIPSINDTHNLVSMIPWYQYPSINGTQNQVPMIPWYQHPMYQRYPEPSINHTMMPWYQYPSINDTQNRVSMIPWYQYPSINGTQNRVSIIHRTINNNNQESFHPELFFSQTIQHGQVVSPSTFDSSIKHGQIVPPSTFIAKPIKPSNTDKSFHPELLKTKNLYFNKCPKTIVLAFKKHQFRTLVKNAIFRTTDPKKLREMTPYRIKNWICPARCILTVWSKKWTKTFLTKWRKHHTNPTTLKIHQPQHPQDGNPTELTTRNHETPVIFQSAIKQNYQPLSLVQIADEPSQANPIYQNTVKPTDVWTADDTDNKTFSLTTLC